MKGKSSLQINSMEKYVDVSRIISKVKEDMDKLNIPYNEQVKFNFSLNFKTTLGLSEANMIFLNAKFIRQADEQDIKNIICHELIHLAAECLNCGHRGKWKEYAKYINEHSKYTIARKYKTVKP